MGYLSYGPCMTGGFTMMLGTFLVIGLILYFIFRRGGCCGSHHSGHTYNQNAIEILKERYAKGEIDTEEYHKRKKELE